MSTWLNYVFVEIAGCKTTALEMSVSSLRSPPSSNGNSSASSEETAALIEALFADQATIISLEHNSPQIRFNHVPVLLQRGEISPFLR